MTPPARQAHKSSARTSTMMRSDGNERASLNTRRSLTSRRIDALNDSTGYTRITGRRGASAKGGDVRVRSEPPPQHHRAARVRPAPTPAPRISSHLTPSRLSREEELSVARGYVSWGCVTVHFYDEDDLRGCHKEFCDEKSLSCGCRLEIAEEDDTEVKDVPSVAEVAPRLLALRDDLERALGSEDGLRAQRVMRPVGRY